MTFFNQDKTKLSEFLSALDKNFVHAAKIKTKLDNDEKLSFLFLCAEEYKKYHDNFRIDHVAKLVKAWNKYLDFVRTNNEYTFQSKFEPSILEESVYRLFADISDDTILVGSIDAYSNLYFSPLSFENFKLQSTVKVNKKNQDFAIYKKVTVKIDENPIPVMLFVPVVAIECKTYLDKTMLEGSIATAEKIKSGNPYCKFFIVTESYEVDRNVEIKNSRIDQIFVLRKTTSKATRHNSGICSDVIELLIKEVNKHLAQQWTDIEQNITTKGIVLS